MPVSTLFFSVLFQPLLLSSVSLLFFSLLLSFFWLSSLPDRSGHGRVVPSSILLINTDTCISKLSLWTWGWKWKWVCFSSFKATGPSRLMALSGDHIDLFNSTWLKVNWDHQRKLNGVVPNLDFYVLVKDALCPFMCGDEERPMVSWEGVVSA